MTENQAMKFDNPFQFKNVFGTAVCYIPQQGVLAVAKLLEKLSGTYILS